MANVISTGTEGKDVGKIGLLFRQFNWRMVLVRVLVNGLSLLAITALLPDISFVNPSILNLAFLAAVLGLLNAFIKPILQFLTLAFIFASYGLVLILINTAILILLSILFPNLFAVDGLLWALVGGALLGILSGALESLCGLNLPISVMGSNGVEDVIQTFAQPKLTQTPAGTSPLEEETSQQGDERQ